MIGAGAPLPARPAVTEAGSVPMNPKFESTLTPPLKRTIALCAIAVALAACSRDLSGQSTRATTHVVANADEVTVRLTDRRESPAKVIGADERTDVAAIKISATNLPIVKLGDPSRVKPGQWVLAIGSPFGFENSATAGIISATPPPVPGENYVPVIQTAVAGKPRNTGGPPVNN